TKPSTNRTAPATISQCGYSIDEKAFVISLRLQASSTSRGTTCGSGAEPTCLKATSSAAGLTAGFPELWRASVARLNQKLIRSVLLPLGSLRTAGLDPPFQAHAFWEESADLVGKIWRPIG